MKDRFSTHAAEYAKYRPSYPDGLIRYIAKLQSNRKALWDCATGNGQMAKLLAPYFQHVEATDISQSQLDAAAKLPNVRYSVQPAESTNFPVASFDMITVAQGTHWFDFEPFYTEVKRVLRPGGVIVITGYGLASVSLAIDQIVLDFYKNTVGPYWDPERQYIENQYKTIPFPFKEIQTPPFTNTLNWNLNGFVAYLGTWSATKRYIQATGVDPTHKVRSQLAKVWSKNAEVKFPILLRVGMNHKH